MINMERFRADVRSLRRDLDSADQPTESGKDKKRKRVSAEALLLLVEVLAEIGAGLQQGDLPLKTTDLSGDDLVTR